MLRRPLFCGVTVWRNAPNFPSAGRNLWRLLLPGSDAELSRAGLPYEIVLQDSESDSQVYLRARLIAAKPIQDGDIPEFRPPEGYSETKPETVHRKISARGERHTAGSPSRAAREMRRTHRLRRGGQDAAWAARQAVLDTAASAINSLGSLFDRFRGRDVVSIDWQEDISGHLDSLEGDGPERTRALQLLNLFFRIYRRESIVSDADHPLGITAAERQAFDQALGDHRTGVLRNDTCGLLNLDDDACRVAIFYDTIWALSGRSQSRIDNLAIAQWDQLEQKIDLRRQRVGGENCWFQFQAWDFDIEIILDGEEIVEGLQFNDDGKIHLVLAVKEIYADFQWSSGPNPDGACSMLCALFSFGLCALLTINYSPWSHLVVEDARIFVEFEPNLRRGRIRWDRGIDRRRSEFDVDMFLLGVNPAQNIFDLGASVLGSWFQAFNGDLLDRVEETIEDVLDLPFFNWPETWHTENGPDIRADAALLSENRGSFEASLIQTRGLPGAIAEDIDFGLIPAGATFSFVVSRRYLTAWVNEFATVARVSATTEMPVSKFEAGTGITLPDPAHLPGAGDAVSYPDPVRPPFPGCDTTPPGPPPLLINRVALTRSAMTVTLPEAGVQPVAGRVSANYRLVAQAVRTDFVPTLHVVQGPCVDEAGDFADHFGGFSEFGQVFMPPEWLRGQPVLINPRERVLPLLQQQDIPRMRESEGITPCCGGNSVPMLNIARSAAIGGPGQGGFGGAGGDIPCPPPFCQWTFPGQGTVLLNYVDAEIIVSADVLLGFSGKEFWLPELTLSIPDDSFRTETDEFRMDDRFGDEFRPAVLNYVLDLVRADLQAYFEPLIKGRPEMSTSGLPAVIGTYLRVQNGIPSSVTNALGNVVTYRQSGESQNLEYRVTESLVYWNIEMEQGVSDFLFPT